MCATYDKQLSLYLDAFASKGAKIMYLNPIFSKSYSTYVKVHLMNGLWISR